MAGRKSRKSGRPPARSVAQAGDRVGPDAGGAPVKATQPAGTAGQATAATATPPGMTRRSTWYAGMFLSFLLGLYVGSLLPEVLGARQAGDGTQGMVSPVRHSEAQDAHQPITPEMSRHIAELEKAAAANPGDASTWTALGNIYFDTGHAALAISAYERSLRLAPDNPDVLTDLGIMYRETGAFDKAVESFRAAVARAPRHENAMFNEGVVLYYDLKRTEEAKAAWQRLLAVNPAARSPDGQSVAEMLTHLR